MGAWAPLPNSRSAAAATCLMHLVGCVAEPGKGWPSMAASLAVVHAACAATRRGVHRRRLVPAMGVPGRQPAGPAAHSSTPYLRPSTTTLYRQDNVLCSILGAQTTRFPRYCDCVSCGPPARCRLGLSKEPPSTACCRNLIYSSWCDIAGAAGWRASGICWPPRSPSCKRTMGLFRTFLRGGGGQNAAHAGKLGGVTGGGAASGPAAALAAPRMELLGGDDSSLQP